MFFCEGWGAGKQYIETAWSLRPSSSVFIALKCVSGMSVRNKPWMYILMVCAWISKHIPVLTHGTGGERGPPARAPVPLGSPPCKQSTGGRERGPSGASYPIPLGPLSSPGGKRNPFGASYPIPRGSLACKAQVAENETPSGGPGAHYPAENEAPLGPPTSGPPYQAPLVSPTQTFWSPPSHMFGIRSTCCPTVAFTTSSSSARSIANAPRRTAAFTASLNSSLASCGGGRRAHKQIYNINCLP